MKKKLMTLILITLIAFNGCWDLREINEIGIVTAVGIDKADEPDRFTVTVQVANPSPENTSSEKSKAQQSVWIGTQSGKSIFDAVRKLSVISSRRIMWSHNSVVIIGESLAKEGIIPVVDYFTHNHELRMKTAVAVARGDAQKFMVSKIGMESPAGLSYVQLENYRGLTAQSVESHMLEVSTSLNNKYGNPLITSISISNSLLQPKSGGPEEEANTETIALTGAAVFKNDKMIGWLSPEETQAVSFILNQTKNTVLTVIDKAHENRGVSIETTSVKSKITSKIVDGIPKVLIRITGKGEIVEEDGPTNQDMATVKATTAILLDKKLKSNIEKALNTIQKKYKTDVLGFAEIVHIQNKTEWENELKDNWIETFPRIPVEVTVDIKIDSSALNQEPMIAPNSKAVEKR